MEEKKELTKGELHYIISTKIKEAYNNKNEIDFYWFCIFTDGSVTKNDANTDEEVRSFNEEMERLKKEGYEIEDVTDKYALDSWRYYFRVNREVFMSEIIEKLLNKVCK